MRKIACLLAASLLPITSHAATQDILGFAKKWTHSHVTSGQVSEIPAFDGITRTLWVAGVVGVDVLNADTGALIEHIDVTPFGYVNSVAIRGHIAAFAVESMVDRRNAGMVLLYDTRTRMPIHRGIPVGSLPDMLTFTPNGEKLLVANEGTPNFMADEPYDLLTDPPGTVSIIDMRRRRVIATPTLKKARFTGNPRLSAGMDFEPEYISVNPRGTVAYVTLQEANAMAILDLTTNQFTQVIDLGLKDFSLADNGFGGNNFIDPNDEDPKEKPVSILRASAVKGPYQPDALANYQYKGRTYIVMANEGDTREDDGDKVRASKISGSPSDLKRLNVSLPDSPSGDQLVTFGGRSFSIRDDQGRLIYDSGSMLDAEAIARNIYDDKRSDDKGVEPEGVTLLNRWGKVYAFIGLERTKASAVAVFDITNPRAVSFVDMIVTDGDISPEGLVTYSLQGRQYLGISNEVSNTTTVYEITRTRQ